MNSYKVNIIFGKENINEIFKKVLIKEIRNKILKKTFKLNNNELTSNSTYLSLKEGGKNC